MIFSSILIIVGLAIFETVSSIDNAVINAEVLNTMSAKARRWFLVWGIFLAVFVVRGVLPWLIVWLATPSLGPLEALTATFSSDPLVLDAIERSAPPLMVGGGIFLLFLFLHWLFIEKKEFGLPHEKYMSKFSLWFYAIVSVALCVITYYSLQISDALALGAVVGSSVFFITHGFKQTAEAGEEALLSDKSSKSDISKILYLEVIDATFSIDGVLGAFAFTLSVPLILLGNGLGAIVVRQLTIGNIERIKKYKFLKNGAMYSIGVLGFVMIAHAFGVHIPEWFSPVSTTGIIAYFLYKSNKARKALEVLGEELVN